MTKEIDALLRERHATHGDYADHAAITQQLKASMHNNPGWLRLNHMQAETLDMIAHKIGRILAGDPNFPDHYDDIAGYARLISQRLSPIVTAHAPMPDLVTTRMVKDLKEAVEDDYDNKDEPL